MLLNHSEVDQGCPSCDDCNCHLHQSLEFTDAGEPMPRLPKVNKAFQGPSLLVPIARNLAVTIENRAWRLRGELTTLSESSLNVPNLRYPAHGVRCPVGHNDAVHLHPAGDRRGGEPKREGP